MAKKSVVELNYTNYGRRSKASAIAVSTQWDSRDSVPTGRETVTIHSSHTTTAEYQTHTRLRTIFQPSSSAVLFANSSLSEAFSPETPRWLCRLLLLPNGEKIGSWILRHGQGPKINTIPGILYPQVVKVPPSIQRTERQLNITHIHSYGIAFTPPIYLPY